MVADTFEEALAKLISDYRKLGTPIDEIGDALTTAEADLEDDE